MAKEAGNKMVGDTLANIAANDTARKDRVDAMHRNAEDRFMQMDVNRELQRSQNITNAVQNASNAMMQAGAAIDGAKSQANTSTTSLTGGSNGSVSAETLAPMREMAERDLNDIWDKQMKGVVKTGL